MGRYNKNYDALGEPVTILPDRPAARISDGEVHARIRKEIYNVVEQECAVDVEFELSRDLPTGTSKEHD